MCVCVCSTNIGFSGENTNLGFSVWYVLCASYVCTWYQVSAGRPQHLCVFDYVAAAVLAADCLLYTSDAADE